MQEKYCSNCGRNTGHKRAIGWGTFFAVLITGGFWFLAIPFYPKRCIMCGGTTVGHITKSADHSGTSNDALINSKDQFKKCPLCAEDIKLEALKCRYCSEEFDPDAVAEEIESQSADIYKGKTLSELNTLLDEAVANEDYEKAAKIRDEISKR